MRLAPFALRLTILLGLFSSAAAGAAVPDTSEWTCSRCPFNAGLSGNYAVGATYLNADAERYGHATGYDRQGAYVVLDGNASYQTEQQRVSLDLRDVGLDSRRISLDALPGYGIRASAEYRELPNVRHADAASVFSQVGADQLRLPPDWQRSALTTGFTQLNVAQRARAVDGKRSSLDLRASYAVTDDLTLYTAQRVQRQRGVALRSGSFFSQAAELPASYRYHTTEIEGGLRRQWSGDYVDLNAAAVYFGNDALQLRWDNPFTAFPGAERGALAEAPDSEYYRLQLQAFWAGPWSSAWSLTGQFGRMHQDESLLPYTVNAQLPVRALPSARAGLEADVGHLTVRVSRPVTDWARVKAQWQVDSRDDDSPARVWQGTLVDSLASGASDVNRGYSYRRQRASIAIDARLYDTVNASAGARRTAFSRHFVQRSEQITGESWAALSWRATNWLTAKAKIGAEKRNDERGRAAFVTDDENPLLTDQHTSYRYRRYADGSITALAGSNASVTGQWLLRDDNYGKSELGPRRQRLQRFALGANWVGIPGLDSYATLGWDDYQLTQRGSTAFDTADWRTVQRDSFLHWGAGVSYRLMDDALQFGVDFQRGAGETEVDVQSALFEVRAVPDATSASSSWTAHASFFTPNAYRLTLALRYEQLKIRDWAYGAVSADTVPTLLTLNQAPYDYGPVVATLRIERTLGQ